jgi:predicted nucleic-acid-binding protein
VAARANSVPDTNAIIRYLVRDVAEQFAEIEPWFERVRTGKEKALLLESVLVESIYILTKYYKVPKSETAESLSGLLHYKGLVNDDKDLLDAALTLFAESGLDPVNCLVLARARRDDLHIVTFDKALKRLATAGKDK